MPTSVSAEALSKENVDYVGIDWQHGLLDYGSLLPMLQAITMVNSRAEAERAVAACRYPPAGDRSYGPNRAGMYLGLDPATVNREVVCLVMIETRLAVQHAEEICSTPGLDGIYIGPSDLSVSMGLPIGGGGPEHDDAIEQIRIACEHNNIVVGIHTTGGEQAKHYAERGFRMLSLASDLSLLRAAMREQVNLARSSTNQSRKAGIYS